MVKRKNLNRILCAVLVTVMILTAFPPVVRTNAATLSAGQQNIVKRAYQMTNIKWTPLANITGWGGGITYQAGKTYTGLPYGQPVYASYVPWSTSLDGFISAVNNPSSKMYTSSSTYKATAPYYSIDCSAFVSWAWGLSSRQTTSTIKNFATQISTTSYANAQVGDCLCLAGSHVVLITDITYDSSGNITGMEISESTVNSATYYCCQKTRYGTGGSYALSKVQTKYLDAGYILYRSKTRDSVTYTHSCASPLAGDSCSSCGYGDYTQTAYDAVVFAASNVTLYERPNTGATQLGTIYTGSKITVTAKCEDSAGVLWYKSADGGWLLASATTTECKHNYSGGVTLTPSCTTDGAKTYTCSICAASYTEAIPATGHEYDAQTVYGSCVRQTKIVYTCKYCREFYEEETGVYGGHHYENYITGPTCTQEGTCYQICSECGDERLYDVYPPTGHEYEDGICTGCGEEEILKGDLDGDREVTAADAVLLARYLAELQELDQKQLAAADIDGDGAVTSSDSVLVARYLAGFIGLEELQRFSKLTVAEQSYVLTVGSLKIEEE